jgi:hypothetical protein
MAQSSDVVAGANAMATDYNKLRADLVLGLTVTGTETDGATVTIDWSAIAKGKIRTVTLAGNRDIVFTNAVPGQALLLEIVQGSGGSKIPTWNAAMTIAWPSGTPPTLSTTAGATDGFLFRCTGVNTFRAYFAGFDLR